MRFLALVLLLAGCESDPPNVLRREQPTVKACFWKCAEAGFTGFKVNVTPGGMSCECIK